MLKLFAIVAALALSACAATSVNSGLEAMNRGDLSTAERLFTDAAQRGEPVAWNNLGVIYERRGNMSAAVGYYRLAARYGVPIAQTNLARLGEPIPPADLAVQRSYQRANDAAALEAASRYFLRPAPAINPPINLRCISYRAGTTVQTTCD